ncbi:MAG: SO_0444 family Cu/Zn efflux transporter [Methanomethylovorans sp.]|uniref:SO_0444 family Cu/Zn efflux transporter n=1 Tax=Methanomethylovorans sp. TaxID=2758717 RepID=UPI0035308765
MHIIYGILFESWSLFLEMSPYLFLGFLIAGILHVLVPDEKILSYLGESAGKVRSVINASLMGLPLPLCSCGVVPTALSLKKRGATKGAALSFMISTPETGVDSIAITYALLDPLMTVFRPLATLFTAIAAGIIENFSSANEKKPLLSKPLVMMHASATPGCGCSCSDGACSSNGNANAASRIAAGIRYAFVDLLGDISKWLIIGTLLAGVIAYLIPEEVISSYLGGGIFSMMIMLLIGIPLYICATTSTPLAAALVAKGMSPGTAFVFLLAGPATNAATITMVMKFLGKKTAMIYVGTIAVCSIGFGLLLDFIYMSLGVKAAAVVGTGGDIVPASIQFVFALVLLPLMAYGITRKKCN